MVDQDSLCKWASISIEAHTQPTCFANALEIMIVTKNIIVMIITTITKTMPTKIITVGTAATLMEESKYKQRQPRTST